MRELVNIKQIIVILKEKNMPKIIIREYDKTKASSTAYNNFAVLVPGFCASSGDKASVFDENGVYECSSQADFETNIGKEAATQIAIVQAAKAPTLDSTVVSAENFEGLRNSGTLYYVKTKDAGDTAVGYLEDRLNEYEPVGVSETFKTWGEGSESADGITGYKVIQKGNEGTDEIRTSQMGNQIAYELLGLGYTVLFKNINTPDIGALSDSKFWEPMKDKAVYDFRYIVTGLDPKSKNEKAVSVVNNAIIGLANAVNNSENTGRGDCIALVDICPSAYSQVDQATAIANIAEQAKALTASKYAAAFAPYVTYAMVEDETYKNTTFPASFHYLACAAKAAENYNEWYAIAGYDRGVSNYKIESVGCKFGDTAINALCPRGKTDKVAKAVNLIAKIKKEYYLWGNRTLNALGDELIASDSLNIRQLCTSIKKQIYVACRKFTFDPNSDVLWINFQNAITPLLEKMKADQGISNYRFIKLKTKKKAVLAAKLRIVPIEAVEDFEIDLTLENSIAGTSVSIEEEK